jgi:hypothetical protein
LILLLDGSRWYGLFRHCSAHSALDEFYRWFGFRSAVWCLQTYTSPDLFRYITFAVLSTAMRTSHRPGSGAVYRRLFIITVRYLVLPADGDLPCTVLTTYDCNVTVDAIWLVWLRCVTAFAHAEQCTAFNIRVDGLDAMVAAQAGSMPFR